MPADPVEVLQFWFGTLGADGAADAEHSARWFRKSPEFDAEIRRRFESTYLALVAAEGRLWGDGPRERLASVIVLDQFSRNMYRDDPRTFAADDLALALAREARADPGFADLPAIERQFLTMPFMHSERLADQELSLEVFTELFGASAPGNAAHFALLHRDIVARFGRFPHRNAILGRESTVEETAFLQTPNSSF